MTTYRLINNVNGFHEAFIDFRAMRKQFDGLKVWFSQKNESLQDKLNQEWIPVSVTFESERKSNKNPDLSVWNSSCLILSQKAKETLYDALKDAGEWFPLKDGYWLFNCQISINGDAIDSPNSRFSVDSDGTTSTPIKLTLLDKKIAGKPIFKPGFTHNNFIICQESIKTLADKHKLGGIHFEPNLAQIFLS